jgi:hypothetical protein
LVTYSRMSTLSPARRSTVSFHTRLGSGRPSLERMRKRPAPWMWLLQGIAFGLGSK